METEKDRRAPMRPWTAQADFELRWRISEGQRYAAIANRLGRTPRAVEHRCSRLRVTHSAARNLMTASDVARLLGVPRGKVCRWIAAGRLEAMRSRVGRGLILVHQLDVSALAYTLVLEDNLDPRGITDADLREWAMQAKSEGQLLSAVEVARRCQVDVSRPAAWARQGILPAQRIHGRWRFCESDVAAFVPPCMR